jgi:hypothetical protein
MAWNGMILTDVAVIKAKERLDQWKETSGADLAMQRYSKSQLVKALKSRGTSAAEHQYLLLQQVELDGSIQALVQQRKNLEADIGVKRKAFTAAKAKFKEVRAKKQKIETPILAEIENILLQHNITAAAYHGGKLNGVDYREFIQHSKPLYQKFETYLLSTSNANRCSNEVIIQTCSLYRNICVTLDSLASKFRISEVCVCRSVPDVNSTVKFTPVPSETHVVPRSASSKCHPRTL